MTHYHNYVVKMQRYALWLGSLMVQSSFNISANMLCSATFNMSTVLSRQITLWSTNANSGNYYCCHYNV